MKLQLTINIEYSPETLNSMDTNKLKDNLQDIADHAYSEGLITIDTPATIKNWDVKIIELPTHDEAPAPAPSPSRVVVPVDNTVITHDGNGNGTIKSEIGIDSIESILLAHCLAGVDVTTPAYLCGLETAIQAFWENEEGTAPPSPSEIDNWQNNHIQFPRLIAEIYAMGMPEELWDDLLETMDLESEELNELFLRAQKEWEILKEDTFTPSPSNDKENLEKLMIIAKDIKKDFSYDKSTGLWHWFDEDEEHLLNAYHGPYETFIKALEDATEPYTSEEITE